jgi:hypothetical protein
MSASVTQQTIACDAIDLEALILCITGNLTRECYQSEGNKDFSALGCEGGPEDNSS